MKDVPGKRTGLLTIGSPPRPRGGQCQTVVKLRLGMPNRGLYQ